MARLLAALTAVVLILVAVDRVIPLLLTAETATGRLIAEQEDAYSRIVNRQILELRANTESLFARAHRQWESIPTVKRADELRVFLIGNSAGMFSIVPRTVEAALAEAYPGRDVSVHSLMLPAVTVGAETTLIKAAIAKQADVIVVTPNLKGLVTESISGVTELAELWFGAGNAQAVSPNSADVVRSFLHRHWATYRARYEIRAVLLQAASQWTGLLTNANETTAVSEAIAAISRAADSGDLRSLTAAYRQHHMGMLIGSPVFRRRLPLTSPVFETTARNARLVRESGAMGVAVFLPVNPIFRDASATKDFPKLQVDDAYVRQLGDRTLRIYRQAAFAAVNDVDALPASAFIDLVHVNAQGTRTFSRRLAAVIGRAVAQAEGHSTARSD